MTRQLWILCLLLVSCRESRDPTSAVFLDTQRAGHGVVFADRTSQELAPVLGNGGRPLAFVVHPRGGSRIDPGSHWLAVESDLSLRIGHNGVALESPALAERRVRIEGEVRIQPVANAATLLRLEMPELRVHVSAWGNLILFESRDGVAVHAPGATARAFPPGSRVEPAGKSFLVVDRSGSNELVTPPVAPGHEDRVAFVPDRETVRFYDAWGAVSAELPSAVLEVQAKGQGIFLLGTFPNGLPGVQEQPFTVLLPLRNRHLLVLRATH